MQRFNLMNEPTDYQLTVHKDNMDATYGPGSFVKIFNYCLEYPGLGKMDYIPMGVMIEHYGAIRIQEWINEFNIKAA